jgi:hypothetical protein
VELVIQIEDSRSHDTGGGGSSKCTGSIEGGSSSYSSPREEWQSEEFQKVTGTDTPGQRDNEGMHKEREGG